MGLDLEDAAGVGLALEFGLVEAGAGGGDVEGFSVDPTECAGGDLGDGEVDLVDDFAGLAVEVEDPRSAPDG